MRMSARRDSETAIYGMILMRLNSGRRGPQSINVVSLGAHIPRVFYLCSVGCAPGQPRALCKRAEHSGRETGAPLRKRGVAR